MGRLALSAALLGSILFFPWWVSAIVAVALAFTATAYEVVIGGVLLDALYAADGATFFGVSLLFTGASLFLFVVAEYAKEHLLIGN